MTQSKKQKMADLQGIRGLAIISVLCFHFYGSYFPNGYLGVDQFFVLSGFLMCMLLTRSANQSVFSILTWFYSRRFKRIIPLYLLFMAITLISLYLVFPSVPKRKNLETAPRALLFVSNQPKTDTEDYFEMLDVAIDVFTHTWSLSVEVQFYFLIPFLFIIGNYFVPNHSIFYYTFIALISFGFNFVLEQNVAFNSMFARIWQFMIGMLVYLCRKTDDEKTTLVVAEENEKSEEIPLILPEKIEEKSEIRDLRLYERIPISTILLLICVSITMSPYELFPSIFRPLTTLITGLLMYLSKDNRYLSNQYLTYIGDISYSLYLIHWPFYAYWKLELSTNQYALFHYFVLSIVLAAIVVPDTIFSVYIILDSSSTSNILLLWEEKKMIGVYDVFTKKGYDAHTVQEALKQMNLSDIIEINSQWNSDDLNMLKSEDCVVPEEHALFGICDTKNLVKTRAHRHRIFVFGNSWSANNYPMIHDECHKNAIAIRMASVGACEPLTVKSTPNACLGLKNKEMFYDSMKEFQPDYAFYFARPVTIGSPLPNNVTNLDDDPNYKPIETELLRMLPLVKKKMFILDAVPNMIVKGFKDLGKMLQEGLPKDKIDKSLLSPTDDVYQMAKKRYAKLFEVCGSKCEKIDYTPEFWNSETNTFRFYDNYGLEYITAGLHLSPHGQEKVRHIYRDICNKMD